MDIALLQDAFEKGAVASLWLKDEPNPPQDVPLLFVDKCRKSTSANGEGISGRIIMQYSSELLDLMVKHRQKIWLQECFLHTLELKKRKVILIMS